ncbi:hypothetical protein MBLNU230_g3248t1 [Neophaeotheca triangularis]
MVILFFALLLCERLLGSQKTKYIVNVIEVPCGFALRWINIFFCPAFVVLPLSPPISGVEVGKIIAVCLIGYAVVFTFTAYLVRALQIVLGAKKRGATERAEEMGVEADDIPLTEMPGVTSNTGLLRPGSNTRSPSMEEPRPPSRTQDPDSITGTGGPPQAGDSGTPLLTDSLKQAPAIRHDPLPLTRPRKWAAQATARLDLFTYSALLLLIGIPTYYGADYSMPLQLTLTVLFYLFAASLPPQYKSYLHPVLVSSALIIPTIWLFSLTKSSSLTHGLKAYKTGSTYTYLWTSSSITASPFPGAGDVLSSALDVSIIALALPMYTYRSELRQRFLLIILPNLTLAVGSLFAYPTLCRQLGISAENSLAFASRSLTLALATPATQNLGGNLHVVAPVAIFSGILGVLCGPWLLRQLRVPEDDYISRGITLGANSSAVATAMLLTSDPRAAAFSSLSMGLFGTITVALTSVPPLVGVIRGVVGL